MTYEEFDDEELDTEPGEANEDVYSDKGREELLEDDEISPAEAAFMEGAEDDGQQAKCKNCGAMIERENTIEAEIEEETCWFCSEKCLEEYKKKHEITE